MVYKYVLALAPSIMHHSTHIRTYWRQFLYQFNELVNVIVVGTSLQVSFNLESQPDYIIKEWRNQIWPFYTHLLWVNLTFVRCVIGKQPSGQNGAFFACDASCTGESMSGFVKYMYIHHKHHYSYSHSVFLCTKRLYRRWKFGNPRAMYSALAELGTPERCPRVSEFTYVPRFQHLTYI